MQRRMPKGKSVHEVGGQDGTRRVTEREMAEVFETAKLPDDQVNQRQKHLTLGLALLLRAREHAELAVRFSHDETMISSLDACVKKIEAIQKEWPVKVV